MDWVGLGLALLSVSAPVTVALAKFIPKRENGNGYSSKYVTTREFDNFRITLGDSLSEIKTSVRSLEQLIKTRL